MDPALLHLLRCPVTRQPLRLVPAEEAAGLGVGQRPVLLREDGLVYYLFDDHGFPHLLPDSGVAVPRSTGGAGHASGGGDDADRG